MSLLITIGCPGAGKSTWAACLGDTILRLERDRFREAIFGSRRTYHDHAMERSDKSRVITQAMGAAMTVWPYARWALTDTGLMHSAVAPFIEYAEERGEPIILAVFDRPLDLLIERNETRPEDHRIPRDILESCYQSFIDPDAWWRHVPYDRIDA